MTSSDAMIGYWLVAAGFENNRLNNDRCVVVVVVETLPPLTGEVARTAALLVGPRTTNPTVERTNAVPTVAESMIEVAAAEVIFIFCFKEIYSILFGFALFDVLCLHRKMSKDS